MPGQRKPGTRTRSFGCEDELWEAALETSGRVGTPISQVLREALEAFVASNVLETPQSPIDLFLTDPLACPACRASLGELAMRGGISLKDAAWAHLEKCPGLVELAKAAGII